MRLRRGGEEEAILLGYTEGVSKGIFSIREKTGLDSKTGQTPLLAFFFFTIYKKPPSPPTNPKITKFLQGGFTAR